MKAIMSPWLKAVLKDPVQRQNLRCALLQKPDTPERPVIRVGGKAYHVFLSPTRR